MVTDDALLSGSVVDVLFTVCGSAAASMIRCIGCALVSVMRPQSNCRRNIIQQTADTMAVFDCSTCHEHMHVTVILVYISR